VTGGPSVGGPSGDAAVVDLDAERAGARALLAVHLAGVVAHEPWVQHVEHDPELDRWYVRFGCDGRDAATIYFDVHQRSVHYELYFLPSPPGHHLELYEWLLRRNHGFYHARFSIGSDGDLYLTGRLAFEHLTEDELDRVIGELYAITETWFQPALRIAYRRP
jgi:hypothetical protein